MEITGKQRRNGVVNLVQDFGDLKNMKSDQKVLNQIKKNVHKITDEQLINGNICDVTPNNFFLEANDNLGKQSMVKTHLYGQRKVGNLHQRWISHPMQKERSNTLSSFIEMNEKRKHQMRNTQDTRPRSFSANQMFDLKLRKDEATISEELKNISKHTDCRSYCQDEATISEELKKISKHTDCISYCQDEATISEELKNISKHTDCISYCHKDTLNKKNEDQFVGKSSTRGIRYSKTSPEEMNKDIQYVKSSYKNITEHMKLKWQSVDNIMDNMTFNNKEYTQDNETICLKDSIENENKETMVPEFVDYTSSDCDDDEGDLIEEMMRSGSEQATAQAVPKNAVAIDPENRIYLEDMCEEIEECSTVQCDPCNQSSYFLKVNHEPRIKELSFDIVGPAKDSPFPWQRNIAVQVDIVDGVPMGESQGRSHRSCSESAVRGILIPRTKSKCFRKGFSLDSGHAHHKSCQIHQRVKSLREEGNTFPSPRPTEGLPSPPKKKKVPTATLR